MKKTFFLFDYLYYRIYDTYLNSWKETMPWLYAWLIVSILQFLNLMLICLSFFALLTIKTNSSILLLVFTLLGIIILISNYLRYNTYNTFEILEDRFKNEDNLYKKKNGWIIIVYIIFSFPVTMFLLGILGKFNNSI